MKYNKLYIKHNEKIRVWQMILDEDQFYYKLYSIYGLINGKLTKSNIILFNKTKKNLDKINLIIKNKYKQKILQGYSSNNNFINKNLNTNNKINIKINNKINIKNKKNVINPMGAHLLDKYSDKLNYPVFCQPKLDGFRALSYISNNNIIITSRNHNVFQNLNHIINDLDKLRNKFFNNNIYLDGELYIHNSEFSKISSLLRKKTLSNINKKDIINIKFYIFDMFDLNNLNMTFEERYNLLKKYIKNFNNIKLVKIDKANNLNEVYKLNDKYIQNNYEGIIVRNKNGLYEFGKKSYDVLRTKEFKKNKFKIINYKIAKNNKTPIWELKCLKSNKTFFAKQSGNITKISKLYKNKNELIGKNIDVKFLDINNNGCITRNPVAL